MCYTSKYLFGGVNEMVVAISPAREKNGWIYLPGRGLLGLSAAKYIKLIETDHNTNHLSSFNLMHGLIRVVAQFVPE
jgi:fructoselysine-6-P-deglycase FrlB-like protein